ncbi:hypothetical protein LguiA_022232 [Lonicera macranthoides]
MVESDLDRQKIDYSEDKDIQSENQGLGFQRDPSFSGWYDEDEILYSDHELEKVGADTEDFDFELPLFPQGGLQNGFLDRDRHKYSKVELESVRVKGSNNMDVVSTLGAGNGSEKYEPFDIENSSESEREPHFSNMGVDGSSSMIKDEASLPKSKSPISAADVLKTLFFILVWYTFSTFLTLYNKTLLGDDMGRFPAPLLMNTVHFGMQAVLSKAITWYWSQRFQPSVRMSWRDYSLRVLPTALGTALDINLSNASLVFISVTFATMCKSAAPIFLLIFAFAFKLESPSVKLLVAKETEFEFWGFAFVMLAAVMSGFRWTMTQILLQATFYDYENMGASLKNPLTLMSYVTPVMALATGLLSLVLDPWLEFKDSNYFNSSWHIVRSCLLMLFGGTLAFFMVLTEYILVSVTSAVTVTIAGVVKEAVTILVAVFYFHDEFTWLKGVGLITIMVGVSLFNWFKYQKLHKGESNKEDTTAGKYVILEEMDDQDDDGI